VNLVPSQYRNVSVADVPVALDGESLRGHLLGRPVYRRTRYVVARHGDASAVIEVSKESELPLFSPVVEMSVLAGPDETAFVDAPETDTAVPTQLARVAAQQAPGARCVIVRGRYGHVSFILDPAPIRIGVVEVVPPWPPKLADQLSRVLELAEDLPPVELVPYLVDLDALAATSPAEHYLFPCRAGQPSQDQPSAGRDGSVSYLDEIPERVPWTLVGCARSKSIHDWFYGGDVPMVDMCPRRLAENGSALTGNGSALTGNGSALTGNGLRPGSLPVITKCCLLEDRVGQEAGLVVVPWGASLAQIREGLRLALTAGRSADPVPR
jgi:hypothetical protein